MNSSKAFIISGFVLLLMFCIVYVAYGYNSEKSDVLTQANNPKSFNSFTDPRDGNVYKVVKIGEQVWMAENLRYLPSLAGSDMSRIEPCYYVYGYEGTNVEEAKATKNYKTYGVLYNWNAAFYACPEGWHLSSDAEWAQLVDFIGGEEIAGGKLKEAGTARWDKPNTGAINKFGFTALPCGIYFKEFIGIGSFGLWWTATLDDNPYYDMLTHKLINDYALIRMINYDENNVDCAFTDTNSGLSVRCVKNVTVVIGFNSAN